MAKKLFQDSINWDEVKVDKKKNNGSSMSWGNFSIPNFSGVVTAKKGTGMSKVDEDCRMKKSADGHSCNSRVLLESTSKEIALSSKSEHKAMDKESNKVKKASTINRVERKAQTSHDNEKSHRN
jgi:hypothetical protein